MRRPSIDQQAGEAADAGCPGVTPIRRRNGVRKVAQVDRLRDGTAAI
jgi:hypothetical protein